MNQYEMKQIAYQSTLKSRALQVLVYLIDRSNKEGTCFPAISTMSRELHISVSTVKRALRELTESGFVLKERRFREKNNGQTSNLYTLCFSDNDRREAKKEVVQKEEKRENDLVTNKSQQQTGSQREEILKPLLWPLSSIFFSNNVTNNTFSNNIPGWPGEGANLIPP